MRPSKFRHVYGRPNKKETCLDNIRLTKSAFDSNLAAANSKYVSVCWATSGGGLLAVLPLNELGKLPDKFPLFVGHKGAVLDSAWNPFDDEEVVTASEDGTIGIWRVPEDFTTKQPEDRELDDVPSVEPVRYLETHGKKVGHVHFNPVAKNILASSGFDYNIRVWNLENDKQVALLPHKDLITAFDWNWDGTKIATISRDKKIRVWDVRKQEIISEGPAHPGAKAARLVWLGDSDRVATTGFSRFSERQLALWDTTDLAKGPIGGFRKFDQDSGVLMLFYDPMTRMVYIGGRGDSRIVYYEFSDDDLVELFAYQSIQPQRGLAMAPPSGLDVKAHEVAQFYKVHETMVEPIAFVIPRKGEGFLEDIYSQYQAPVPAMSAQDYVDGKVSEPVLWDWELTFEGKPQGSGSKPRAAKKETSKSDTSAKSTEAKSETKTPEDANVKSKTEGKKEDEKKAVSDSGKEKTEKVDKPTKTEADSDASKKDDTVTIPTHLKAQKQDAYEVFQSNGVKSFLDKANAIDEDKEDPRDDDQNTWSDDDDKESKDEDGPATFVQKGHNEVQQQISEAASGVLGDSASDSKEEDADKNTEESEKKPQTEDTEKESSQTEEPKSKSAKPSEEPKSEEPAKSEKQESKDSTVSDEAKLSEPKLNEESATTETKSETSKTKSVPTEQPKLDLTKPEQPSEDTSKSSKESKKSETDGKTEDEEKPRGPLGKLAELSGQVQDLLEVVGKLTARIEELEAKNK